jgi:signal transduction histidine kinase
LTGARVKRRALTERLAAEREERRRLGELIHDGPVQSLAAITQMLEAAAQAAAAGDTTAAGTILTRATDVAREAAADLRELVDGIEPAALHERGFAAAVRELADRVGARRAVQIDLEVDAGDSLGDGAQVGLYQIVREALDQAVRRGPPSRVTVAVRPTPAGGAELVVADDGSGERRQAVLEGLAERAATLNGDLRVEQGEGGGTSILVVVPPSAAQR